MILEVCISPPRRREPDTELVCVVCGEAGGELEFETRRANTRCTYQIHESCMYPNYPKRNQDGTLVINGGLMLAALNWVLDEQMAGRQPNDLDVANYLGISPDEAAQLREKLEEAGEF